MRHEQAILHRWRMNWEAWKVLAKELGGMGVLDDDSGKLDVSVLEADQARQAFFKCTIGPARHFK